MNGRPKFIRLVARKHQGGTLTRRITACWNSGHFLIQAEWNLDIHPDPITKRKDSRQPVRENTSRMKSYFVSHVLNSFDPGRKLQMDGGFSSRKDNAVEMSLARGKVVSDFFNRNMRSVRRERPEFRVVTITATPSTTLKIENPGQTAGEIYGCKGRNTRNTNIVKITCTVSHLSL